MIKVVLFIMDHIGWVYLGVLVSVGAIASQTSIALAVLLVFACGVALHAFLHNSNPLAPWLRERYIGGSPRIRAAGCAWCRSAALGSC
jgi:hypothetical protein